MRKGIVSLLWMALLLALAAAPLGAQDVPPEHLTRTPVMVLVPSDAAGTFTDLTPLRDAILETMDALPDEPPAPAVIYVEAPAETEDGLTFEQIGMIGLFLLLAAALWFLRQNNVTAATLIPMPLVQEVVKSAVNTGLEAAQRYAAATPTPVDDELVRELAVRVALFFNPPAPPPISPPEGMHSPPPEAFG